MALGSLAVLYLEFFEFFETRGWIFKSLYWPEGITPKNTIYLVILGMAIFVACRVQFSRLTPANVHKFRDLVLELYWAESYAELFAIFHRHLPELFRIYDDDFALARFRSSLSPSAFLIGKEFDVLLSGSSGGTIQRKKRRGRSILDYFSSFLPFRRVLYAVLPNHTQAQNTARELVRAVFLSPRFVTALVRTRPYLGLAVLGTSKQSFERNDFAELYFKELMRDPQSVLYTELQNSQETARGNPEAGSPGRRSANVSGAVAFL
jgi:hypothetical protein